MYNWVSREVKQATVKALPHLKATPAASETTETVQPPNNTAIFCRHVTLQSFGSDVTPHHPFLSLAPSSSSSSSASLNSTWSEEEMGLVRGRPHRHQRTSLGHCDPGRGGRAAGRGERRGGVARRSGGAAAAAKKGGGEKLKGRRGRQGVGGGGRMCLLPSGI